MEALFTAVYTDPLRYIGYFLAFFAAMGGVLFIAGFGGGIPHHFTFAESDSHMEHARARITMGLLWCMVVFGLWEIVRVISGQVPPSYLWLSLILLTPVWIPWVKALLKGGGGDGEH